MHLEDLVLQELTEGPVNVVLQDLQVLLEEVGLQALWAFQEDLVSLAHLVCADLMDLQVFPDQEDQAEQLDWLDLMVFNRQIQCTKSYLI